MGNRHRSASRVVAPRAALCPLFSARRVSGTAAPDHQRSRVRIAPAASDPERGTVKVGRMWCGLLMLALCGAVVPPAVAQTQALPAPRIALDDVPPGSAQSLLD